MKKILFILLIVSGLIALDLVFPRFPWEEQMESFFRNNLSRVMSWMHLRQLA